MIIPASQLSPEALEGLIESFITREGTDYGVEEVSLSMKVEQVKRQLIDEEVLIIYDPASESVNMMTQYQYQQWLGQVGSGSNDQYDQ